MAYLHLTLPHSHRMNVLVVSQDEQVLFFFKINLLVFGSTVNEYELSLKAIIKINNDNQFTSMQNKCLSQARKVKYSGQIVSQKDSNKTSHMKPFKNWTMQKTVPQTSNYMANDLRWVVKDQFAKKRRKKNWLLVKVPTE